jgi:hypothetical protein
MNCRDISVFLLYCRTHRAQRKQELNISIPHEVPAAHHVHMSSAAVPALDTIPQSPAPASTQSPFMLETAVALGAPAKVCVIMWLPTESYKLQDSHYI